MNSLRVKWNVSVLKVEVKADENKRVLFICYIRKGLLNIWVENV